MFVQTALMLLQLFDVVLLVKKKEAHTLTVQGEVKEKKDEEEC